MSFEKLVDGEYVFETTKFETQALYNNAPGVRYALTCKVLEGPPQADGKAAKGKVHWVNFDIKSEDHPDMAGKDPGEQISVGELKSFLNAAGVEIKGDSFTLESCVGCQVSARVSRTASKAGDGKVYVNTRNWKSAE
jgi:hypothetical protein